MNRSRGTNDHQKMVCTIHVVRRKAVDLSSAPDQPQKRTILYRYVLYSILAGKTNVDKIGGVVVERG